ncbi:MAG: GNAT family N-acetyltransferase [Prevotellaceae bacterium]|jgi:diamine N-acetyltransferase|nr:GNAT family N-acetyltransferase [Prevotellaceae bacterium]
MLGSNEIILRAVEPSDLETLYQWENNADIWGVSSTLTPFSKYNLKRFIEQSALDIYEVKQLRLMVDLKTGNGESQAIGTVDLFDFDPMHLRAGVGILINDSDKRGNGYATQALRLLINYSFSVLRLHQLYCNVASDNKPSLKLFQNVGFEIVGCKKEWRKGVSGWVDEYVLQLLNRND